MPRRKLRSQGDVVERSRALGDELRAALTQLPSDDPAVVDAIWRGEALGTLLWALQLAELPSYDQPFDPEEVAAVKLDGPNLRDAEEVELDASRRGSGTGGRGPRACRPRGGRAPRTIRARSTS